MIQPPYRTIASIYNPDLLTKEQLINSFVVRLKKFEKIMADLRTATMEKPEQPIMLVGLRGMGKTTMLRRIAYEVENDPNLNQWLVPVIFNEEEYGITTLFKLWETIAEYLEKKSLLFAGLFDRMDEAHSRNSDRHRYEVTAFDLLTEALHAQGKKLLLIIDNFGNMFKRFNKQEKQRLREIMMTSPDMRVIASGSLVSSLFRYDEPLYEFFKIEHLEGLNRKETELVLNKIGTQFPENPVDSYIKNYPEKIEAIRRVTGGIPRSIIILWEILFFDKNGSEFSHLETIMDRLTPLYKHRIDDLPTQQQSILLALGEHFDAMSARELAERTRLNSKQVSAQLSQMQDGELIQVINSFNKNHLYQIKDRFLNIWLVMRIARKDNRNRVKWLVEFLRNWLTIEDNNIALKDTINSTLIEHPKEINDFLLLLAKSQYTFLYDYFNSEEGRQVQARERFAPIWYALMHYLRGEHPLEFLRMPPELSETVQEIIAKVETEREAYALTT
jgi:nucleoside-triphosphatase THEP1